MHRITSIATMAAAVAAFGAFGLGTAASAAPVTETTAFTYTAGSAELTVAASNLVPPKGTQVSIVIPLAETTQGAIAADVINTGAALAAAGIPAADVAYGAVTTTTSPAGYAEDVTVTLYTVTPKGNAANEFEVSGVAGGVAIPAPAGDTGTASVTWSKTAVVATVRPHVSNGHVISLANTRAVVGWNEGPGVTCEQVRIWGYGFSAADGSPHVGFTCDTGHAGTNEGYLTGLAPDHTYALEVVPAEGTYGNNNALPNAQVGWINLVTTR